MKFFLVIQSDPLFLPKYLDRLLDTVDICGAVIVPQKLPRETIVTTFYRYLCVFGLFGFARISLMVVLKKMCERSSVEYLLKKRCIPFKRESDINADECVASILQYQPDNIISIGCPQKIGNNLINAASGGAINLHGGFLPDFPGVFTPFWNLYERSEYAGCTVHKVSEVIDGGPILLRTKFRIAENDTVFSLYNKIADRGIDLLINYCLNSESIEPIVPPSEVLARNYHSFPTWRHHREFRRRGCRIL